MATNGFFFLLQMDVRYSGGQYESKANVQRNRYYKQAREREAVFCLFPYVALTQPYVFLIEISEENKAAESVRPLLSMELCLVEKPRFEEK